MNQIVTSDCKYLKFNVPYCYFLVCADLWSGQIFVVTVCSWRYHDRCWRKILDFDVYTAKKLFPKKQFHLRLLYSQCFDALIRIQNLPIDLRKGRPYKTLQIFISLIFFVFFFSFFVLQTNLSKDMVAQVTVVQFCKRKEKSELLSLLFCDGWNAVQNPQIY